RGGEFSSDLLRAFCRSEGIRHTFTLPASPQQNGIAERHIGMVMDVARTSMIHAAAPHFLWPFAVRYAAHHINLQPRVSLPETTPTLRWTGKVGDASAFRVWGSRALVRDTTADKLSSRAVPCVFLGFPPNAPKWQFYHPTSRRVLSSQDVTFELQKRHTCRDLGELTSYLGLRITRDRAQRTITLTQSYMVQQVLQRFSFTYSSPQSTPLPTGHSLSTPPSDESVEPSGPYLEVVGCLIRSGMGLVLGGWARVVLTGHADASRVDDLATQRSSQGYTCSLGSGSVSWRSTRSSSVLSSSCEAEIYAGAMAAQELSWLTYLLTDLGEAPRSPPVLYVDNKAMLALCQEHRLEHKTKHIALRYFLARELQQLGQLRLAYVAS
ncbi:unnamed protein product, partial [Closterium sp. NIES-53]